MNSKFVLTALRYYRGEKQLREERKTAETNREKRKTAEKMREKGDMMFMSPPITHRKRLRKPVV